MEAEDDGGPDAAAVATGASRFSGVPLQTLKNQYLAIKDARWRADHRDLMQAMVTYHHLGKREISAFLRAAHPGKDKKRVINSLDYQLTVGGMQGFLLPGAGGVSVAEQEQSVAAFDVEQHAKRARQESARIAGIVRSRLGEPFHVQACLWREFQFFELIESMRHKGDPGFGAMCLRLREHHPTHNPALTDDDWHILQGLVVPADTLTRTHVRLYVVLLLWTSAMPGPIVRSVCVVRLRFR